MQILDVRTLAQREARTVLMKRFCPTGWNREGSRKVDAKASSFNTLIEAELAKRTDPFLLDYPENKAVERMAAIAAEKRTFAEMAEDWVQQLFSLPRLDQEDANALADAKEQSWSVERVMTGLDRMVKDLEKLRTDNPMATEELTELIEQVETASKTVNRKRGDLARAQSAILEKIKEAS